MEQRTVVAIILCVVVLFSYESVFVAPKRAQMLKEAQLIANQQGRQDVKAPPAPVSNTAEKKQQTTKLEFEQLKWDFKTTSIYTILTNVGGTIHSIGIGRQHPLPLTQILAIKGIESSEFHLVSHDNQKTVFAYEDSNWRIMKSFQIKDDYTIMSRLEIVSSTMSRLDIVEFVLFNINFNNIDDSNQRETMLDEYSLFADQKIMRKGSAVKFSSKEDKSQSAQIQWAGFRDHYSAVIIRPEFQTKGFEIKAVTEKILNISVKPQAQKVMPGKSLVYEFTIFAGPQDIGLMKKYGKGFEKIVAFSNFWLIDAVAKAIYYTIPFLHRIFKSWGISIILISLIIYGLTYPLTIKSMLSMRKMQQMQPKIKALQERYKDDSKKLNAEIMEIYKREKINPLGGCLPFLLQMPIFIALYQVLWRSFYFQGASFLWVKDLTQPDRLFILPFSLPFLGNEFNILPILMAAVMFVQQKLSAKNMVITDEQQAMQQKMMLYFFPGFIGFIFYKFASGLSLYFTVFYLLSTLTQWKMSKVK